MKELRLDEMYEDFIKEKVDEINRLEAENKEYNQSLNYVRKKLQYIKDEIPKYTNVDYEMIKSFPTVNYLSKIKFGIIPLSSNFNKEEFLNITKSFVKLRHLRRNNEKKINELKRKVIQWKVYKHIVGLWFKYISKEIVENGYIYNVGFRLGSIYIRKHLRRKAAINWGKSNKVKAKLIKQGITPYNKDTAPDGEKWFVYIDQPYTCWFFWKKAPNGHNNFPNGHLYSFRPTNHSAHERGLQMSNVKYLFSHIENNPLVVHKYMEGNEK